VAEPARPLPIAERLGRNGLEPSVRIVSHRSIARCAGECDAVQEIAEWLDKLGMVEYAQRLAENGFLFSCRCVVAAH
jgi:hypothetical protein